MRSRAERDDYFFRRRKDLVAYLNRTKKAQAARGIDQAAPGRDGPLEMGSFWLGFAAGSAVALLLGFLLLLLMT